MIIFLGTKKVNKNISNLIFQNEQKAIVEIPIQSNIADMITTHLRILSPLDQSVECLNDEESD